MVKKAHGCDSKGECWVTYIQQLSSQYSSYVVTSGNDGNITLWQVNAESSGVNLIPKCTLSGHTDGVYQTLEVSDVPDMLASASRDKTIRLWTTSNCSFLKTLKVGAEVRGLENYPGGNFIISGDVSGRIYKWNVVTGNKSLLATLPSRINDLWLLGSNNQYLGVATSNNCNGNCSSQPFYDKGSLWLLNLPLTSTLDYSNTSTYAGNVYFVYGDTAIPSSSNLDLPSNSTNAHFDSVRVIDPLPEIADQFATASSDFTTRVWSISNKNLVNNFTYHIGDIAYSLDHVPNPFSANSVILIDGSRDTNVNAYLIPKEIGNRLRGAYSTDQQISSLRIVNESNVQNQAFISLICLAFIFACFL